jgi:hypothetical protein
MESLYEEAFAHTASSLMALKVAAKGQRMRVISLIRSTPAQWHACMLITCLHDREHQENFGRAGGGRKGMWACLGPIDIVLLIGMAVTKTGDEVPKQGVCLVAWAVIMVCGQHLRHIETHETLQSS